MDPFLDQLRRLCRDMPTRAKWLFVPTHANGRTIGDRLAREAGGWANLRVVTPLDVALRMGAPFLVERGVDPSEEGLGPALMMRLLLELPRSEAAGGYFRPLATQPAMAASLWSTIRELRMAGLRASDLRADAFASAEKHAELSALLAAYESYLASTSRGDQATVFEEALRHPDWCPIQPSDCWTELPDVIWPPLHRRLIDAMPGERLTPSGLDLPGIVRPRRLREAPVDRLAPRPADTFAWLTQPELMPRATPAATIAFFHAGGVEAEIEEVFRRIVASGRSLDDVEIACASPQYASLIWEKAMRYDWPVTLAQGISATLTRPGRALLSLVEWIEDDFAAGRLRRMLQSGDLRFDDDTSISPGRAARVLVRAQAAWGRETYRLSLGRLATSARAGARRDDLSADQRAGLEDRAAQADELARWIDGLLETIPTPDANGDVALSHAVACARGFLERAASRASALDTFAAAAVADAIGQLAALGEFRCPLDQALRFLRERVESVTVGVDRPRPGHLYVSALGGAGYAGRSQVFVVGLEEGRVFPASFEDPILLDRERPAILAGSRDRIDEAVYAAVSRLAAISAQDGARISLSYSCRDLREYRQTHASWLLLQAYRAASGSALAAYHHLHDHLGTAVSCVPGQAGAVLDESRWWLRTSTQGNADAHTAVLRRYPALQAAAVARAARLSAAFTPYDGYVPEAGAVLDPCAAGAVVSPTQLEGAAECPFRHFLKRGLGVDAIETGERDRDVWLTPLLRGSLLHDLYAQFVRRCRSEKRRARMPADGEWLRDRGEAMLADLAVEMPPPSREVRDRETHAFLNDLAIFADAEAALDAARTPVGCEVSFGRAGDTGVEEEPLAQAEPVAIDLGGGSVLRVAGRIDRIDRVGSGTYQIVDYKTGTYWRDGWQGTFAGGTRLQHALYGLAAAELLKRQDPNARVAGAQYYFSSAKGHQERKVIDAQPIARVREVLADVRGVIKSGLFVHAHDTQACRFCDFGHACGRDAADRAAEKLGDAQLAPYVRLTAHE
jgi:hypothetical protein